MTREESRDRLKHLLDNIPKEPPTECDNVEEWLHENEEIRKAIETAIEILSAEPCDDAISRQAVNDIVTDIQDYLMSMYNPNDSNEAEIIKEVDKSIRALYKLPSVQPIRPKGEWIKSKDGYMRCNQCGSRGSAIKPKFCPNCGADISNLRGAE